MRLQILYIDYFLLSSFHKIRQHMQILLILYSSVIFKFKATNLFGMFNINPVDQRMSPMSPKVKFFLCDFKNTFFFFAKAFISLCCRYFSWLILIQNTGIQTRFTKTFFKWISCWILTVWPIKSHTEPLFQNKNKTLDFFYCWNIFSYSCLQCSYSHAKCGSYFKTPHCYTNFL